MRKLEFQDLTNLHFSKTLWYPEKDGHMKKAQGNEGGSW